jgi:hypothetical protein
MPSSETTETLELLELIEKTDRIPEQFERVARKLGPYFTLATAYVEKYEANRIFINERIAQLGGLWMPIDAANGVPAHIVQVGAWEGRDPDDPSMHSWQIYGGPDMGQVALHPDAIDEIRQKLLTTSDS